MPKSQLIFFGGGRAHTLVCEHWKQGVWRCEVAISVQRTEEVEKDSQRLKAESGELSLLV